jgi:hypothetical protein
MSTEQEIIFIFVLECFATLTVVPETPVNTQLSKLIVSISMQIGEATFVNVELQAWKSVSPPTVDSIPVLKPLNVQLWMETLVLPRLRPTWFESVVLKMHDLKKYVWKDLIE